MPSSADVLIAVDIGNSRIKLGRFDGKAQPGKLPEPAATLDLPLTSSAGDFESEQFGPWCDTHLKGDAPWRVSSVHRGATEKFIAAVAALGRQRARQWTLRQISFREVPLAIELDQPERVGMDRLLAAMAANRLRPAEIAAIVVDLGTAIKVDLLTPAGVFSGGAILPGLAMSARALDEHTDALPTVDVEHWYKPPPPLGKATVPAIEAGLFWGAVGAIRELVALYSGDFTARPQVFITGGGSQLIVDVLSRDGELAIRHVPHLVLSGIALVDAVEN